MRRHFGLTLLLTGLVLAGCSAAPRATTVSDTGAARSLDVQAGGASSTMKTQAETNPGSPAPRPAGTEVRTGSIPLDPAKLKQLQATVDQGHMPGNLDPVEVTMDAAASLGFAAGDQFRLDYRVEQGAGSGTGEAYVDVLHQEREYLVQLIQPVRSGQDGIWAVNSVRDLGPAADNFAKLTALRRYFDLLAQKDYQGAYSMLSRRFRQGFAPEALAANGIEVVNGIDRATWNSPSPDELVVRIRVTLAASSSSAWGQGEVDTTRFVQFIQEDGAWKIAGLATSP